MYEKQNPKTCRNICKDRLSKKEKKYCGAKKGEVA
jgi:hypothetical protein